MSQSDSHTLESVEKLLAERRKIAGWMSALDARRAETSAAVYQRVHDDYTVKMDKVHAKLVAASDAVQLAAADVATRLVDQEQGLAVKQEERAEAELRASVGEYSEKEWDKRRTRLNDDITSASGERDALREELARLRRVLGEVAGTSDAASPSAEPSIEAYAAETVASGEPYYGTSAESDGSQAPPAIEIQEQAVFASLEPAMPLEPSFDELAFLNTVVGRPTPLGAPRLSADVAPPPFVPSEPPPRPSQAAYTVPEPSLTYPDAMPEPRVSQEMTPPRESFFGRPTPRTSEAVKSLKCQECGTLNFPTEWYCERCGGELAAM